MGLLHLVWILRFLPRLFSGGPGFTQTLAFAIVQKDDRISTLKQKL
jgi:hypothetical protein